MGITNHTFRMKLNRRLIAVLTGAIIGWACTYLAVYVYKDYAGGLFLWLPFAMGITTVLIGGATKNFTSRNIWELTGITVIFYCLGLILFAWEGLICIIMVAPLGYLCSVIGGFFAYYALNRKGGKNTTAILIIVIASVPALMAYEDKYEASEDLQSVTTSVIINASKDQVWKNVIAFSELDEPDEFIFRTGIAYPVKATIDGRGVGAIRRCTFSTGSFVEPITTWNEPDLLAFSVQEQPEPLKEVSFYDVRPLHLHGYWVSKKGQFKLTELPDGKTLLEGTTWYYNKVRPSFYWKIWSNHIVHKIHRRVLSHIRKTSEKSE